MKFGRHLEMNMEPEWADHYVHYKALKKILKKLVKTHLANPLPTILPGSLSLSVPKDISKHWENEFGSQEVVSQEVFFMLLESEIKAVQDFTDKIMSLVKERVSELDQHIGILAGLLSTDQIAGSAKAKKIKSQVDEFAQVYLKLERYVNLNFMAFSKILKKHDKLLPNPAKPFYMARLLNQKWIRGDYSGVLVKMSRIHSTIRADVSGKQDTAGKQDFVRSTTKYWVKSEDVSRVKYMLLQHLPVFMQPTMDPGSDSQLLNSVYLDNASMELYNGRLDKSPGAIALRLRWYGTGLPKTVYVERKTHRDAWTGMMSVKERFKVNEDDVQSLFEGTFDIKARVESMRKEGKSETDISNWETLATECCQAIKWKQLVPTMRTQYMRTAFQIPFDASVRVSLDTNLTMFYEKINEGDIWYRAPNKPVPPSEITRFPHAILEVKLTLSDESLTPQWVRELLNSGLVVPVHKFSKFIHGCAVLMSEDVQYMPYWIDDPSIRQSIVDSQAERLFKDSDKGANKLYSQLLPDWETYDAMKKAFLEDPQGVNRQLEEEPDSSITLLECLFPCFGAFGKTSKYRFATQKVEPKLALASERVAIHWLHYSVTIASISFGLLAFAKQGSRFSDYALLILPVAFLFAAYSVHIHFWRSRRINSRIRERWDDPRGPVILTVLLVAALSVMFCAELYMFFKDQSESSLISV